MAGSIDIESVLERIYAGESQADIAASLGISPARLSVFLNQDEETAKRSARAREESAEGWLDKGLAVIQSALDKEGGIDAGAARAYAQECARRAAIRNPRYRESNKTELTGPNGGPVQISEVRRTIVDPKPSDGSGA